MNDTFEVVVSSSAKAQLVRIISFVKFVSPEAAKDLQEAFVSSLKSLKSMPERHPCIEGLKINGCPIHFMVVENRYAFLYKVKDSKVFVEFIIDNREDNSDLFSLLKN